MAPVKQAGDVLAVAPARPQYRFEPWEREVLGQILVRRAGGTWIGLLLAPCRSGRLVGGAAVSDPRRRIARRGAGRSQVLGIALPGHVGRIELVEQGLHALWVDTTV